MAQPTCDVCGLPMHRYGFPVDGLTSEGEGHKPTAIGCANSIIALIAEDYPPSTIKAENAITRMGHWINGWRPGK